MRRILAVAALALCAACSDEIVSVTGDDDLFVIQAYLYTGRPVDDVLITYTLPIDADSTQQADPVTDARVRLVRAGTSYALVANPAEPGRYYYPGSDLTVRPGDEFRLEVERGSRLATAQTTVPDAPRGLSLSASEITFPQAGEVRGGGGAGLLAIGATAHWDNPTRRLHFVVVENTEANPVALPIPGQLQRGRFRLVTTPTAADSSRIGLQALQYYGGHQVLLYRVNQEYADLYLGRTQDSRELNEPPSNVQGALGIFSAFAADSTRFVVK